MLLLALNIFKWMFFIGVALWFLLLPLIPFYGLLRPWPEAVVAIREQGNQGTLLMIGAGGEGYSNEKGEGYTSRQRMYLAVPESFTTGNLFIYTVTTDVKTQFQQSQLDVDRLLPVIAILWLIAGAFSTWVFVKKWKKLTSAST